MFVNNYQQSVVLAPEATEMPLALPDGEYRLTLRDARSTRWEIVDANVHLGIAALQRGREGTAVQDWPFGSLISCSVTAGWLNGIATHVDALYLQIANLATRVGAIEAQILPDGTLTDTAGNVLADGAGNTLTQGA